VREPVEPRPRDLAAGKHLEREPPGRERLAEQRERRLHRLRRRREVVADVRRAGEHRHPVGERRVRQLERVLQAAAPVVEPGQHVTVEVDHGRRAVVRRIAAESTDGPPGPRRALARLDRVPRTSRPTRLHTFWRLLAFLAPYRVSLVVSIVLAVAAQASGMAIPELTQRIIDDALPRRDDGLLWVLVGLIVAFGVVKALLMVGRRLIAGKQALGVEYDLRNHLYGRLLRLSTRFFDRFGTGQLMSRATVDLQNVRFFLGYGLIFLAQHVLTVVGVTVLLFVIDWELALVALAITPVLVAASWRYSHVSHPVLRDVQQRIAEMTAVAQESIVGVNVVKAFAREEHQQARFAERVESIFRQSLRATRQQAVYTPFLGSLPLLAQAAVLVEGGRRVVGGELLIGQFVQFNVYLLMLVFPLRMLGMWIGQIQRAIAAGERIFEILDEPEEVAERPAAVALPPGGGRLVFEGVTFGYDPARPVLEEIDLELAPGRVVALIGHTGAGKSTLAGLVPRFYDPTAGRVLLDGVDLRDLRLASLRRAIGIVSQDPFLFSATVRENIAFGAPGASDEDVEAAARAAQAHDFVTALPDGYDTLVGERGITLSGGQRQRIAIARALLVDPRVLILDDATASVDATTEARIRLALREVMEGRTTLIVAHRLSTISLADEIVVLERGRIAARGAAAELRETSDVYREIEAHGLLGGGTELEERLEATA
jgi:ATP-binding cassette subfamily B protein